MLKEIIPSKVKLLERLNSNLNSLLSTEIREKKFEELHESLALIDECIEQAMLLISLEIDEVEQLH